MNTKFGERGAVRSGKLQRGLSLLFFVVLIGVSVVEMTYVFTRVHRTVEIATELSAAGTAEVLARTLEPLCADEVNVDEIRRVHRILLDAIPGARTYIIGDDGTVLANLSGVAESRKRIDPAPLHRFLALPRKDGDLFLGEDPADAGSLSVFAAARTRVRGKSAFVYMVLRDTVLLQLLRFQFDESLPSFIVGTVGIQTFIVGLLAILLHRVLTSRLRALVGVLNRYRSGDHSARAEVNGTDELAELARTTNEMAETIEQKIEELADRDRRRRELIAHVAHDLRAPASVIKGYSSILGERAKAETDETARQMYTSIMQSSDSLAKLLGELWELSKLEAREHAVSLERVPLGELVEEIAGTFREAARQSGVSLTMTIPELKGSVMADPVLLSRALRNLIENALTYTHSGGSVEVRMVETKGGVRVEVRDTGVGISAEDLPQIFERSFRVKKWEDLRQDSGGLGLTIVRRIIEAHGQKIVVESHENEGSVFSFEMPWIR